jgi:hypothetical protein
MYSRFSVDPPAYSSGLMKLAACGENVTPARRDITTGRPVSVLLISDEVWQLTGFREVEPFLAEVRDQSKERDPSTQRRADDIEVGEDKSRHLAETRWGNGAEYSQDSDPMLIDRCQYIKGD